MLIIMDKSLAHKKSPLSGTDSFIGDDHDEVCENIGTLMTLLAKVESC